MPKRSEHTTQRSGKGESALPCGSRRFADPVGFTDSAKNACRAPAFLTIIVELNLVTAIGHRGERNSHSARRAAYSGTVYSREHRHDRSRWNLCTETCLYLGEGRPEWDFAEHPYTLTVVTCFVRKESRFD